MGKRTLKKSTKKICAKKTETKTTKKEISPAIVPVDEHLLKIKNIEKKYQKK